MNIICRHELRYTEQHDIKNLVNICKNHDNTHGNIFLGEEDNAVSNIPCFYLGYQDDTLCAALTVFLPSETEGEIYAYTHPDYRNRHYFSSLLKTMNEHKSSLTDLYFTAEPQPDFVPLIAGKAGASFSHSDYLLCHDRRKRFPENKRLRIFLDNRLNDILSVVFLEQMTEIGTCRIFSSGSHCAIYNFEIHDAYRGQGYGKEALLLILSYLIAKGLKDICLHVNSTNTTAVSLYLANGFEIKEQLDYYKLPCH